MIEPTSSTEFGRTTAAAETSGVARTFARPFGHISWSAIFAGAVIALAVQLVLTLIGAAIGLATLDGAGGDSPSGTAIGFGAGLWLLISSVISLFIGGYIAARLAGIGNGWLHGLTTWGLVTLLTAVLLSTAIGGIIGTASGLTNFARNLGADADLRRTTRETIDRTRTTTTDAEARQTADAAAKGTAAGTGAAALGFLVGAIAAAFGGRFGERHVRRSGYGVADDFAASPAATRR